MGRGGTVWMLVVACSGCIGPYETRYLSCIPRRPDVEARSYDWHDPFPDERIGPETASRPRAFQEPRSDTRKNFDLRFLQAMHPTAGTQLAPGPMWPGYGNPGLAGTPFPPPSSAPGPVASSPWPNYNVVRSQ